MCASYKLFRFFVLTLFFSFVSVVDLATQQEGTIKGVVVDRETGKPIAKANVFVRETDIAAATDEEGAFSVRVRKGNRILAVSHSAFAKTTVDVVINPNGETNLEIELDSLPPRTERFNDSEQPLREIGTASTIYTITEKDIERLAWSRSAGTVLSRYNALARNITLYVDNQRRDPTLLYAIDPYLVVKIVYWRSSWAPIDFSRMPDNRCVVHIITRPDSPHN